MLTTFKFEPIKHPKLKANWLSAISLMVLCAMMFLTLANVGSTCDCEDLLKAAREAIDEYREAVRNYNTAKQAYIDALNTDPIDWDFVRAAQRAYKIAKEAKDDASDAMGEAVRAYHECLHNCSSDDGGCDDGGCDDGGCD